MTVNFAKLPELLHGSPPIRRDVTRLQPHISRQSAECPLKPGGFNRSQRNTF
jgi:hypothetical protein